MKHLLKLSKLEIVQNLALSGLITLTGFFAWCVIVAIISLI